MKRLAYFIAALLVAITARAATRVSNNGVTVGADRPHLYLHLLQGKRVALYSNHTGLLDDGRHTLDMLVDSGIDVRYIFSPEHGFRGDADNGAHVSTSRDTRTGLPILSLFGRARTHSLQYVDSVDVIVTDIQDVGLRFYTYYITMIDLMDRAIPADRQFIILDRPNPLSAMGVDGPTLDMVHRSGVGRLPIPVLHGMTLGELARMASASGWLAGGAPSHLTVIPCHGYTHATRYQLPVPPSPNLPDMHSVYLYPSTCLFEGTPLSLGRGTPWPFRVYGHPDMHTDPRHDFTFTPRSRPGATKPPLLGRLCHGVDLRHIPADTLIARGFDPTYIIDAYRRMGRPATGFFTSFFTLLAGTDTLRAMIEDGLTPDAIRATWAADCDTFARLANPHLLYE